MGVGVGVSQDDIDNNVTMEKAITTKHAPELFVPFIWFIIPSTR